MARLDAYDVSTQFGSGCDFEGFRHGSRAELATLLTVNRVDGGLAHVGGTPPDVEAIGLLLRFGPTVNGSFGFNTNAFRVLGPQCATEDAIATFSPEDVPVPSREDHAASALTPCPADRRAD